MSGSSPSIEKQQQQQQSPPHIQDYQLLQQNNGVVHGNTNDSNITNPSSPSLSSPSSSSCYHQAATTAPSSPANTNQTSVPISAPVFMPTDHRTIQQQPDRDVSTINSNNNNSRNCLVAPSGYCDSTSVLQHQSHRDDNLVGTSVIPSVYNIPPIPSNGNLYTSPAMHEYLHASTSGYLPPSAEWIAAENGDTSSILAAAVAKAELDPIPYHHGYPASLAESHHRGMLAASNHLGNGMDSWAPWVGTSGVNGDHPSGDEMSQGHHLADSMEHSGSPGARATASVAGTNPLKSLQQQPTSSSTSGKPKFI